VDEDIFIALPVYRGTEFVAETIRSIRDQTYSRYHVMMSVDGSDDPTIDVCRSFTADPRFELVVQPERLGWPGNFNWLVRRCNLPYFCYWQQDDLASTGYLESLRNGLLTEPEASIAYTDVQWFGSRFERDALDSIHGTALERVLRHIESIHYAPLRGLIRASALPPGTEPIPTTTTSSAQSEFVFLTELAARGSFHRVTTAMYFKRGHHSNAHSSWFAAAPDRRRSEWISTALGMLGVALRLTDRGQHGRLLATVLDRFAIERPGRGYFYIPEQSAAAIGSFVHEFTDRAAAAPWSMDLTTDDWVLDAGDGFERPIHTWITTALMNEVARARALASLSVDASSGPVCLPTTVDGPGLVALGGGWSTPETSGVWTEGTVATLRLPPGQYSGVELTGVAFVADRAVRIGYSTSDAEPMFVRVANSAPTTLFITVPPATVDERRSIHLHLPDAVSPAEVDGSADTRVLGFQLRQITFVTACPISHET